jgi:pyruvate,water dikinase
LALHKAGLDIPPFFILTTKAVQHLRNQGVDKKFILEVKNVYKTVIKNGKVAVRSSATIEDSRKSSFAGQFKTVLNVDINNLYEAIKEVYSSISNVAAVYGPRINRSKIEMAIIIQKMVNPDKAGVIFTADPVDGNKAKIIVEVVKGLGEALVSGSKTPTRYYISKTDGSILNRSGKNLTTQRELKQLYGMAISIEKLFGHPQDIEFAIKKGKIYILQSRDITTL